MVSKVRQRQTERELREDLQDFSEVLVVPGPTGSAKTMRPAGATDPRWRRVRLEFLRNHKARPFGMLTMRNRADRELPVCRCVLDNVVDFRYGINTSSADAPDRVTLFDLNVGNRVSCFRLNLAKRAVSSH